MAKQLKIWNGRGFDNKSHLYIAAYSAKQVIELVKKACGLTLTSRELNIYFVKGCWGNAMEGIVPTEPCVYASKDFFGKPEKII
jgi:hypothetical protein